jgi:hypothetical protein
VSHWSCPGWPRYNTNSGALGDADPENNNYNGRNNNGHFRYGSYGLNVGIGNLDDDAYLEVVTGFDNHQFQSFKYTGVALTMGPYYTSVRNNNKQKGQNITWGQMTPRWTFLVSSRVSHLVLTGCSGCSADGCRWPLPSTQRSVRCFRF